MHSIPKIDIQHNENFQIWWFRYNLMEILLYFYLSEMFQCQTLTEPRIPTLLYNLTTVNICVFPQPLLVPLNIFWPFKKKIGYYNVSIFAYCYLPKLGSLSVYKCLVLSFVRLKQLTLFRHQLVLHHKTQECVVRCMSCSQEEKTHVFG